MSHIATSVESDKVEKANVYGSKSQSVEFEKQKKAILDGISLMGHTLEEQRDKCARLHSYYEILTEQINVPHDIARDAILSKTGRIGLIYDKPVLSHCYVSEDGDEIIVNQVINVNKTYIEDLKNIEKYKSLSPTFVSLKNTVHDHNVDNPRMHPLMSFFRTYSKLPTC